MATIPPPTSLLLPLQLDAFVLNQAASSSNNYRIAPITQPNYTFMRLHDNLISPDILDHVDLHDVTPAQFNPRVTDIGSGILRQNRLGVYVSWTLPQVYRQASAAAPQVPGQQDSAQPFRKLQQGYPSSSAADPPFQATSDYTVPDYRPVPNRWLVTRRLNKDPQSFAPNNANIPVFQSWLIESDRISNINDPDFPADLEVDRTPFINPSDLNPSGGRIIEGQAEIFIGRKSSVSQYNANASASAPRVDPLTIAASANPLFPDFQHHNSNVFSMLDNFQYTDSSGNPAYLTKAKADYFVVGWHSAADHDPLTTDKRVTAPPYSSRLDTCNMSLKDASTVAAKNWLGSSTAIRTLCHASMYDVSYVSDGPPAKNVLADTIGQSMAQKQSISVGSTAFEALNAYCRAHVGTDSSIQQIEKDLLRLQTLLATAESDDVDALQAAIDEQFVQSFKHIDGGPTWHFHQENTDAAIPSDADRANLRTLNEAQAIMSSIGRLITTTQWQLFSQWWLYVSGFGAAAGSNPQDISKKVTQLVSSFSDISRRQAVLSGTFNTATNSLTDGPSKKQPQKGTSDRFYRRNEPTILLGNIKNGWAEDFTDSLQVRLDTQVVTGTDPSVSDPQWQNYLAYLSGNVTVEGVSLTKGVLGLFLPPELVKGALALYKEFYYLRTSTSSPVVSVPSPQVIPWFHDEATSVRTESRGRDRWQDTQPFKPLFVEWEAIYFHIPFEKWNFREYPGHTTFGNNVVHYGFPHGDDVSRYNITDMRTTSGRVLLLPQARTELRNTLQTIFLNTNAQILANDPYKMPLSDQTALLENLSNIDFVSAPLTGLTEDLLTLHQGGMHVKPMVRFPNAQQIAIDAAVTAAANVQITKDVMNLMGSQTTLLPYGQSVDLDPAGLCPMKPVTHGQLMLTKLNIIDRFGQAIAVVDPKPHFRTASASGAVVQAVTPCLSDSYFPGTVGDADPSLPTSRANTVFSQSDNAACPLIQLTPSINQPARINAGFVVKDSPASKWRLANEWENPIWGFIVINYADAGVQLYTQDGTFYREVRLGGPSGSGATAGLKWLPFTPSTPSVPSQLDYLIAKLSNAAYLTAFFDMLNRSISEQQVSAPTTYSEYTSSIIGKPIALTTFGWSLELADHPPQNTSSINVKTPERSLLKADGSPFSPGDPNGYTFPLKIGDHDRSYDGLVGLLPSLANPPAQSSSYFDLSTLLTYYPPTQTPSPAGDPRKALNTSSYVELTPFYNDPLTGTLHDPADDMIIFGALVDPFLPVHGYTAILPNVSLRLPDWTTQQALSQITAFLHAGPLVTPLDVPDAWTSNRAVNSSSQATPIPAESQLPKVTLPLASPTGAMNGGGAQWRWLQPYVVDQGVENGGTATGKSATGFNAFGISDDAATGGDARQAKLAPGPYTAIEGFIQLVRSSPGTATPPTAKVSSSVK